MEVSRLLERAMEALDKSQGDIEQGTIDAIRGVGYALVAVGRLLEEQNAEALVRYAQAHAEWETQRNEQMAALGWKPVNRP